MVHIIISMLTVSAHAIEVRESIEEFYHGIKVLFVKTDNARFTEKLMLTVSMPLS